MSTTGQPYATGSATERSVSARAIGATGAIAAVLVLAVAGPALGQDTAERPAVAVPSDADQLGAAVLAAPVDQREGATVLGWNPDGTVRVLRQGSNELMCLADDPRDEEFSVACYHRSLEPYMARGRELTLEGVQGLERNKRRWDEAEAGLLELPKQPATLHVLHGSAYDAAAGAVLDPYLRWSIYIPGATPESTGLDTRPAPGAPWLMDPGTPGAHIMIVPPQPEG